MGLITHLRLPSAVMRFGINLWPPFVGAGIHVTELAPDFRKATVRLRHGLLNRNYFGTHYGGSLFSMTDPFYAIMLLHNLPRGYRVWDKASRIEFKTPGRGNVFARFTLTESMIADVLAATAGGDKYEPTWQVDIKDEGGEVVATVDKTLYIRRLPPSDKLPAS
jgi:acyl-coenzyme A thioesterase PaaI-like protein